MADVLIEGDLNPSTFRFFNLMVWKDTLTGYYFFTADVGLDFRYRKTEDGGASWGASVQVFPTAGNLTAAVVWYDRWTPGDEGTVIHCTCVRNDVDGIYYRQLETDTDVLAAEVQVRDIAIATLGPIQFSMSLVKAKGGNLYIAWYDSGAGYHLERSSDGGGTWTTRSANFFEDATELDRCFLVPAPWSDDDQDIAAILWDRSANELTLKVYDDSADSISETLIASMTWNWETPHDVAIRASDDHLIVVAHSDEVAAHDLRIWDINGPASITELTPVFTATEQRRATSVLLDPSSDKIYVAYSRPGTWFADVEGVYHTSEDGGSTWSGATAFTFDATRSINTMHSPVQVLDGGLWAPVFVDEDSLPRKAYINTDNAVTIEAQEEEAPPAEPSGAFKLLAGGFI